MKSRNASLEDVKINAINVKDIVRIRVPNIDRGRTEPRSILDVLLETKYEFYKTGPDNEAVAARGLVPRSHDTICKKCFVISCFFETCLLNMSSSVSPANARTIVHAAPVSRCL